MFEHTDTPDAPWYLVHSDDKKRARLNCIAHILSQIFYKKVDRADVKLPARSEKRNTMTTRPSRFRRLVMLRY